MRENQGWQQEGLSHERAVKGFQAYIKRFQQLDLDLQSHLPPEKRQLLPAEAVVRQKLDWESESVEQDKGEFFSTLRFAWDALAYDRYKPGSQAENLAGSTVSMYFNHNRVAGAPRSALCRLPLPRRAHQLRGLAVFPVPIELAHGRGDAGSSRYFGHLRDDPAVGPEIRPGIRQPHPSAGTPARRQMAS